MRILLIIATLAVFVVNALAQTTDVYEVYAIEYAASLGRSAVKDIAVGSASQDSIAFSFYIWYLKGDNGRRILVDTGFLRDSGGTGMPLREYQRPDLALRRIGVGPDEITDVIITHPHYDHIGGLGLFGRAAVWMQKNDYAYFVGEAWQKGANNAGLDRRDVPGIVRANTEGRLQFVNGDSVEIIPGVRVFTGSKHTFESQHLLVNTKAEKVLLASDDAWFYCNIDSLLSIPLVFDQGAYVRQLRRMKTLVSAPGLIVPGHDPQVLSRFTKVASGVVRIR
jgi:glyoxylase-like metal-dependent hydrolase (beta-lactamase superfamily II)